MKKFMLILSLGFTASAYAYNFKCDVELYTAAGTEKLILFSENEEIQTTLNGHDISIQFAHRQVMPVLSDYYRISISGPDTSPYVFSGYIIQSCGFGTRSIQLMCAPKDYGIDHSIDSYPSVWRQIQK